MTFDERSNARLARLEGHLRFYKATTLILLALVIVLSAVLGFGGRRKFARAIRIDGELMCLVRDQQAAERVHRILLDNGKGELPGEAALEQQWEDAPWPVDDNQILSVNEAVEALTARVTVLVDAWAIQVDGTPAVVLPSEDFARSVLDALKARYLKEGDKLVEAQTFLEDVKIAPHRAAATSVVTEIAAALERLSKTTSEPKVYTVQAGDWIEKIAEDHGMSVSEFRALNPDVTGTIHPGDQVKVAEAVQGITVKTVKEVTRTVEIEPELDKNYSVNVPRGETRVLAEGVPGRKLVVEHHTYHNDRLVETKAISGQIVEAPTPRRVLVGTGETPAEGGGAPE